jgi:hypothetical protein
MTATHSEIMPAPRNLHDHIRQPICRQTEDIFHNPAPFHASKHVFDDDTDTGNQMIEALVSNAQLLASGFFWGCWVRTRSGS